MTERLAVIIASKNRPADIVRALVSLRDQTSPADDIIVIDQSTNPYELADYPSVRHIYDPSIRSLASARNRGLTLVDSPRVLFIDDDVKLRPQVIAALHVAFDTFPDAVGFQLDDLEHHDLGRLNSLLENIFEHGFFSRRRTKRVGYTELAALEGFGMAYRASVFDKERFDDNLIGYSFGEDWDFSKRAARYGKLIVAPGAELHHYRSPANRNDARAICLMRWINYNRFYNKIVKNPTAIDRIQKQWWQIGETYRWLRNGLGLPSDKKALRR